MKFLLQALLLASLVMWTVGCVGGNAADKPAFDAGNGTTKGPGKPSANSRTGKPALNEAPAPAPAPPAPNRGGGH